MSEKKFELRTLTSQDIFPMCVILRKIGIKDLKELLSTDDVVQAARSGKGVEAIGLGIAIDLAGLIVSNLPSCESEIYSFLASVSGIRKEELKAMSMADFLELIGEVIHKEEFRDFFAVARGLLK